MTHPTRADAIELLEYIFMADMGSIYATNDKFEAFLGGVSVEEAEAKLKPWLDGRGITDGIVVLPDSLDGELDIDCALIRITTKERPQ